jgi:hypothetical protein
MPRMGFEPTILVFEREKTVHALDRAAPVIGFPMYYLCEIKMQVNIYVHLVYCLC